MRCTSCFEALDFEAFDNCYRSLADTWEKTPYPPLSTFRSPLSSIALFLLLDLLGSSDPKVPSYFKTSHWAYRHLAKIESRLRSLSLLQSKPPQPFLPESEKSHTQFNKAFMVQDDHIPFMARGVEVLHIIPTPFPKVWHKITDDGEHLDMGTVEDWTKMVTAFVGEWMDLEGYFPPLSEAETQIKAKRKFPSSKTEL